MQRSWELPIRRMDTLWSSWTTVMKRAFYTRTESASTWLLPNKQATLATRQCLTSIPVVLMMLVVLFASPAYAQSQQDRDNPTVKETLHWLQTSLEIGAGDYSVGHETRSWRLEDFVGCRVHFSYSTRQGPFANGEPAPDKKPYRADYFFSLRDIDIANIRFSKGPGDRLDVPSIITITT